MPTPRVTIDELPEQVTALDEHQVVIQDAGVTKRTSLATIKTLVNDPLVTHIADSAGAHAATAISTVVSGEGIDGVTVQAQLIQVAEALLEGGGGVLVEDPPGSGLYYGTDPEEGVVISGLPVGGTAGQVLTKDSGDDYDTSWVSGGGITVEDAVDAVAAALVEGTGIDLVYDDTLNTITVTATGGGGGGITVEDAVDAVAAALVEGTGIDLAYDDGANTITVTVDKTEMSLTKSDVGLGNVDNTADTAKPVSTATQTALDLKATTAALTAHEADTTAIHGIADTSALALKTRTINTYSGTSLTAVLGDAGTYVRCTGTNPTYTIPLNSSVAFPVGTQIDGVGTATAMTIAATGGVTINKARTLVTVAADSGWTAIKVATDEWDLHGDFV